MALMITACSSNDIEQTAPQPSNRAEGIPFTATISIGESATTRALSEDATNNKIVTTWAAGEKVALIHNDVIDVVEVQSVSNGLATLTGTLTGSPANNDEVTIIYPSSAADGTTGNVKADLLAAQDGTLATIAEKYDVRKGAGTLNVGATATLYGNVSLTNQFAIVKFSLTDGTDALDATHPLVIKDNADNTIVTVTPTTSTTTVYVAMEPATAKYFKFSATTAESKIISKSNTATIAAGNYYQTTLAVPALGDLYYTDGTYSTTLQDGKTPIGVIVYLGTDNFTENGTDVGGSTFVGHGLVLCLKNAASGADAQWSTETSTLEFGDDAKVTDADGLKRTTSVSGYTNTKTLAEKTDAATKYKAAYNAYNYTGLTAPAGTTGWFLPSAQQWVKMQEGLGELDESAITWLSWFDNSHTAVDKWEAAFVKAGAGNYDSMTSAYLWYWSSSEQAAGSAVLLGVEARGTDASCGFRWYNYSKDYTYDNGRVRPVLAF